MKKNLTFSIENIRAALLISEKIYRALISIVFASLIARTYGPDGYGQLGYIITSLALISVILSLGLEGPLLRDLSLKGPFNQLNPYLKIKQFVCTIALLGALVCFPWVQTSDRPYYFLLLIYIPLTCFELYEIELLSNNQQTAIAAIKIACCTFFAIAKFLLIINQMPLYFLIAVYTAEPCVTNFSTFIVARKNRRQDLKKTPFLSSFKRIIIESTPLWGSTIAIATYTRVDQIIIAKNLGEQQLGIYIAALQIIGFFNFIPVALYSSHASSFLGSQANLKPIENEKFIELFIKFNKIAIASTFMIFISSNWIVSIIYGNKFIESASILRILSISNFFIFMGVAHSLWILSNQKPLVRLYGTIAAAILSITLNILLTPHYGLVSAAIIACISQSFAAFFANYFWAKESFKLQTSSLGLK